MADNSQLDLPGKFKPGMRYWMKGETLIKWQENIKKDRVIAGPGIEENQTPQGRIWTAGGGVPASGPFCTVFKAGADWKLRGGVVSGGSTNETISDITIGTVGAVPADGTFYWLECEFTALSEEGILLPGGDLGTVTEGNGSSLPDNVIPTGPSPSGSIVIPLGQWLGGGFAPSGCGDISITHCPGTLAYSRSGFTYY